MPLTQADIDDLKQRYRKSGGRELSDKEAWDLANRLLALYRLLQGFPRGPDDPVVRR